MTKPMLFRASFLLAALSCSPASAHPTSQPSTAPTQQNNKHPASKPTSKPASRPASKPTQRPISKDVKHFPGKRVKLRRPKRPVVVLRPLWATSLPARTGWLSFALSPQARVWLDGFPLGPAPISYIRLAEGKHHIRITHPRYKTKSFVMTIPNRLHTSLGRQKNKKLGFYRVRGDSSEAKVILYPKTGRTPRHFFRSPGRYCPPGQPASSCVFLTPGEQLYVQADGRTEIIHSARARLSTRPFQQKRGNSQLTLYSYPPGALFLNRKLYALTPVARLPLKAGTYNVWIRNGYLNMDYHGTITLKAGHTKRAVVYLVPRNGGSASITSRTPAQITINGLYRGWTPARVLPLKVGTYNVVLRSPKGPSTKHKLIITFGKHTRLHRPR